MMNIEQIYHTELIGSITAVAKAAAVLTQYHEDVWNCVAIAPCILNHSTTFEVSGHYFQFEKHCSIRHKWKNLSTALLKLCGIFCSSGIHMISDINIYTLLVCKGMIWLGM